MPATDNNDAEYKLSVIAQTPEWPMPTEITQYVQAVREVAQNLSEITKRLNERDGEGRPIFECQAKYQAQQYCSNIITAIRDVDIDGQVNKIQEKIDSFNEAIRVARNVSLPGDALDAESQREIMKSTEPLDYIIPGLGEITGIAGITGVNLINRMLATNRDEVAREEYRKVLACIKPGGFDGRAVPVVDPPSGGGDRGKEQNDNSGSGSDWSIGSNGSVTAGGVSLATGAVIGTAATRAVMMARNTTTAAGVGVGAAGGAGVTASGAAGVVSSHPVPAPPASGNGGTAQGWRPISTVPGSHGSGSNGSGNGNGYGSGNGNGNGGGSGSDRYEYGDYVYDPVKHQWVHKDDKYVSVDSGHAGLAGGTGFGGSGTGGIGVGGIAGAAGVGAGVGVGGALAAGKFSSSASAGLAGLSGAGLAGAGLAGGAGGIGLAGAGGAGGVGLAAAGGAGGVGSYYANTPVHATLASSSSIKGATGMAAGLSSPNGGASAGAASGAAARGGMPGMMGGQGGASGNKKQARRGLGYIAPVLEDDEEFEAKPLAAMAGRRRRPDEQ